MILKLTVQLTSNNVNVIMVKHTPEDKEEIAVQGSDISTSPKITAECLSRVHHFECIF